MKSPGPASATYSKRSPQRIRASGHDIDDALNRPVMMRPGLGVRLDVDCSRPELLGARARGGDGGSARHAWGLRRIGIQLAGPDDADAMSAPIDRRGHSISQRRSRRAGIEKRGQPVARSLVVWLPTLPSPPPKAASCPTPWTSRMSRPSAWSRQPHADALAGLRANEARYFRNKYDHEFTVKPASDAAETIEWVHRVLEEERDLVIASPPLEATAFEVEDTRWAYVFYENGLSVNVMYGPEKRAVGFKLSDGMDVPAELESRFKFARQKSKLAGTIRGSYFVIQNQY